MHKKCRKCGKRRAAERGKDIGLCYVCHQYKRLKTDKKLWVRHREHIAEWRENNRSYWRAYYLKNREKLIEYSKLRKQLLKGGKKWKKLTNELNKPNKPKSQLTKTLRKQAKQTNQVSLG